MEIESARRNVVGGAPVVVDEGDSVARFKEIARFDLLGSVRIDDYENGLAVGPQERLLGRDEEALVLGELLQLFDHDVGDACLLVCRRDLRRRRRSRGRRRYGP